MSALAVHAPPDTDFSRERLLSLLESARSRPDVMIRHDVDYDVGCAVQMAELEADLGVRATYYLLADTEDYDLFLAGPAVQRIRDCGHDLASHVDLHAPRHAVFTTAALRAACIDTHAAISRHWPVTRKVSFHQPPRDVIGRRIPWFESAQAAEWQGRYAADSRGVWRVSPEELLERGGPFQMGLHCEWWWLPEPEADAMRAREAEKP